MTAVNLDKPARHFCASRAARAARPAPRYCRATDLPKLIGLWPAELADTSPQGRALLIGKLKRALRQERLRGLGGHWTYDLARHSQLVVAYRIECAALERPA
jgi:hypothetical protein